MKYVAMLALGLFASLIILLVIYFFADRIYKSTYKNIRLLEADLLSGDEDKKAAAERRMTRLKRDYGIANTVANNCIYLLIIAGAALLIVIVALVVLALGNVFLP
ncbi:hypothetical protein HYT05_04060 [Candidatus Kaiserbacteria bacterium]|nr:hypothetical protein [Candidatus Kaiserbacteria bacterium]